MAFKIAQLKPRKPGLGLWLWKYGWGALVVFLAFTPLLILNVFQALSLVLLLFWEPGFRKFNTAVSLVIWGYWAWALKHIIGLKIHYTGDKLPPSESSLILANHQGFTDIMALLCFGFENSSVQYMKWMVKDTLKYVPAIGWGMLFVDCVFLKRNWSDDKVTIQRTFARYKRNPNPIWLVIFPEGTRWTPTKLERSRKFAAKHGMTAPQRVLIPRIKGFAAAVDGLGTRMNSVVGVTLDYGPKAPTLLELIRGDFTEIHMEIKRTAFADLPKTDDGLEKWLRDDFASRDLFLQKAHTS